MEPSRDPGIRQEGRTDEVLFELHPRGDLRFRRAMALSVWGVRGGCLVNTFNDTHKKKQKNEESLELEQVISPRT
jgi:hypothetical protein